MAKRNRAIKPGNVAGLDISLTNTGIYVLDKYTLDIKCSGSILSEATDISHKMERLLNIRDNILQVIKKSADYVFIEGYSFGSKGRSAVSLGELGGVVRASLVDNNKNIYEVPPKTLKMFMTDYGNANKDDMLNAVLDLGCTRDMFERQRPRSIVLDDNLVDAWCLAYFGAMYFQAQDDPSTADKLQWTNKQRAAMKKFEEIYVA